MSEMQRCWTDRRTRQPQGLVSAGSYLVEQHATDVVPQLRIEESDGEYSLQFGTWLVGISLGACGNTSADRTKSVWYVKPSRAFQTLRTV